MDVVIAILVLIAGIGLAADVTATFAARSKARRARLRVQAERETPWTVATISGPTSARRRGTLVVARRITKEGVVLDQNVVAEIPEALVATDWLARVGEARAEAASRVAELNSEP